MELDEQPMKTQFDQKWRILIMTVYVLSVNGEIIGVYDEYIKAYNLGCEKYDDDFDLEEFDVE